MAATERKCAKCGRSINVRRKLCSQCNIHPCSACSVSISGYNLKCWDCRASKRICPTCEKSFTGNHQKCEICRIPARTCIECGCRFRGNPLHCSGCRAVTRKCITCERLMTSCNKECGSCRTARHPDSEWSAMARQYCNTRRARKLAAQVVGPVPAEVYAAILASGPCVYCGALATTIDHIRPLARGGHEVEANLVPACRSCNSSKSDRLLTEWRPDRVARAVAVSPLVQAEYERQATEVAA